MPIFEADVKACHIWKLISRGSPFAATLETSLKMVLDPTASKKNRAHCFYIRERYRSGLVSVLVGGTI